MPAVDREPIEAEAEVLWRRLDEVGWAGEDVDQTNQLGILDGRTVVVDYGRGRFVAPDRARVTLL